MPVFTRSTIIPATPQELFQFHENPHNLRLISPPGLRILEINARSAARPGEQFHVAVRQGPLTLRWTGCWETVDAPSRLVDIGVRCPFAHWQHAHSFEPCAKGSFLTDRIEYHLPWQLGGPVADWIAKHPIFPRMFAARHSATLHFFAVRT